MQDDALLKKVESAIELQRMSVEERPAYELSISAKRGFGSLDADTIAKS